MVNTSHRSFRRYAAVFLWIFCLICNRGLGFAETPESMIERGIALAIQGRFQPAARLLNNALSVHPSKGAQEKALYYLALLAYASRETEKIDQYVKRILQLNRNANADQFADPHPDLQTRFTRLREKIPPRKPKPRYGFLNLVTTPWTNVYIDGRFIGPTPLAKIKLPAETISVRFVNQKEGIDVVKRIRIRPGITRLERFNFPKVQKFGYLNLVTKPWTQIYAHGKFMGETPRVLKFTVGKHRIRLVNRNHRIDQWITVTIRDNETKSVFKDLK